MTTSSSPTTITRKFFLVSLLFLGSAAISSAFSSPSDLPLNHDPASCGSLSRKSDAPPLSPSEQLRQNWVEKSVNYYAKVMREERRRSMGQEVLDLGSEEDLQLATKHYFALQKIKGGQHRHAEMIYRRIIDDRLREDDDDACDHSKLAVTTLLLALHCQRMGEYKKARSVFLTFFRVAIVENDTEDAIDECACSAKVLGAYALFEFKQGNTFKSLEIAKKAVQYDNTLSAVLNWKQFRDVELKLSQKSSYNAQSNNRKEAEGGPLR
jgi:tetratricopeptide (TPR) repeat protein